MEQQQLRLHSPRVDAGRCGTTKISKRGHFIVEVQKFCYPETTTRAIAPPRKISWTLQQRLTVCVLQRWYRSDWPIFGAIFKTYFATELKAIDKSPYMLGRTLRAQWSDIKAGVKDDAYRLVFENTLFSDEREKWQKLRDDFEQIAAREGLMLEKKCENKIDILDRGTPRKARTAKAKQRFVAGSLYTQRSQQIRRQQVVERRVLRRKKRVKIRIRGIAREKASPTERVYDGPPRIGFRSYNEDNYGLNTATGFRAGKYKEWKDVISQPPDITSDVFDAEADKHLSRDMTGSTSLISLRDSLMPALHIAMHKRNSSIAVIDLTAAHVHTRVYSGAWAIGRLNKASSRAWNKTNQYRGNGEWLVWGEIRQEAVIATFTVEQLCLAFEEAGYNRIPNQLRFPTIQKYDKIRRVRNLFRTQPRRISPATGFAIGRTIKYMGVPDRFLGYVVQVFVRDWELIGDLDPGVRADFVRNVVLEGFLTSGVDEVEMDPLFAYRVGRLMEEVDSLLYYPAKVGKLNFGKTKRQAARTRC
ncbi:MAG: hypothetical protein M1836_003646 [Candelina mexicana]|nr:MAG: hypothetical protein M1836_003646 [Candelina mexicana]